VVWCPVVVVGAVSCSLTLLRPKHVDLILKINKYCYLLHLVGLDFITLPTLKMHGQTKIKCPAGVYNVLYLFSSCLQLFHFDHKKFFILLFSAMKIHTEIRVECNKIKTN
jgi:hypothetical protein